MTDAKRSHAVIGILTSLEAFVLAFAALFAVSALVILITTAEAGQNSSIQQILFLSSALLLLSEGSGITFASLLISVIPLGITLMVVFLVRAFALRHGTRLGNYVFGLVVWCIFNSVVVYQLRSYVHGNPVLAVVKTLVFFSIGFLLAAWSDGHESWRVVQFAKKKLPLNIVQAIARGVTLVKVTFVVLGIISVIVLLIWLFTGWNNVGTIFTAANMPVGSRIITSVLSLAWIPNFMVWALAWICGSQFQIGTLSLYSMAVTKSSDLPLMPVFGIFPTTALNDAGRVVISLIPMIAGLVICFAVIWLTEVPGQLKVNGRREQKDQQSQLDQQRQRQGLWTSNAVQNVVRTVLFSLGIVILAIVITAVVLPIIFQLSNGALGVKDLAVVGVPAFGAAQAVARPFFAGYLIAWVIGAAVFGVIELVRQHRPVSADSVLANIEDIHISAHDNENNNETNEK
jgi:hypothetical protein